MFDAANSIDRLYEPYLNFVPCPPGTSMEAAIATAAHQAMSELYASPSLHRQFDALYASQLAALRDGRAKDAGIALGKACAGACAAARANDGADDFVTYVPGSIPGDWIPTPPNFSAPASPHWPNVTPWCMTSGDQFRPTSGPYGYNTAAELLASPQYAADYEDVRTSGALDSVTRTADQTQLAIFWANDKDGTFKPPGQLFHITQVIAQGQGNSLLANARLFALVALGMADAGIAAWDCKYSTDIDLWRPITAIRAGDADGNPATVADLGWEGLSYSPMLTIYTPPFPAWISGHATFGASHAAVVRHFYGTDAISFTATSDDTPGYYRSFTSLREAALENARSRIYLGVHFQMDADGGNQVGTAVGDYVSTHFLRRLGDLDGDGIVAAVDLGLLLGDFGATSGASDLNRDRIVDAADLAILLGAWG